MEYLYDQQAKESGCYVIGSCGLDSIPNDLGILFCKEQFPGNLNTGSILHPTLWYLYIE